MDIPPIKNRIKGEKYLKDGKIVIWNGKRFLCEHGRQRYRCKDCGGGAFCQHGKRKCTCKKCGGSSICEHGRERGRCRDCGNPRIYKKCEHGKQSDNCKICSPKQYTIRLMRIRLHGVLNRKLKNKTKKSGMDDYLGCSIDFFRKHIEKQFTEGMTWENQGEWHIDHVRPCASFAFEDEIDIFNCFNWRNLQPMWGSENQEKNDKYDVIEDTEMSVRFLYN